MRIKFYCFLICLLFFFSEKSSGQENRSAAINKTDPKRNVSNNYESYKKVTDSFRVQNNFSEALKYYKLSIGLKDSIFNAANLITVNNLKRQYETEKKEQEINLLNTDKKIKQQEINKQKTTRNIFLGGSILFLLFAIIIYNLYRVKQKANIEIEHTLLHLKNTQEQIIQRAKLASLGKITVDVAREMEHPLTEINNLFSQNKNIISQLRKDSEAGFKNDTTEILKKLLEKIYLYGKHADKIVKKILVESRNLNND